MLEKGVRAWVNNGKLICRPQHFLEQHAWTFSSYRPPGAHRLDRQRAGLPGRLGICHQQNQVVWDPHTVKMLVGCSAISPHASLAKIWGRAPTRPPFRVRCKEPAETEACEQLVTNFIGVT